MLLLLSSSRVDVGVGVVSSGELHTHIYIDLDIGDGGGFLEGWRAVLCASRASAPVVSGRVVVVGQLAAAQ